MNEGSSTDPTDGRSQRIQTESGQISLSERSEPHLRGDLAGFGFGAIVFLQARHVLLPASQYEPAEAQQMEQSVCEASTQGETSHVDTSRRRNAVGGAGLARGGLAGSPTGQGSQAPVCALRK